MKQLPPLPVPTPDPRHQLQGLRNREHGKAFEDMLDRTFDYYNERGFAIVDKTPEPMKVLRRLEKGRFIACFLKKAQPDYKGTMKGGRSVMFEAKYTTQPRMAQDVVSEAQWKYLDRSTALGARCYVLAGFKSGGVYRIPWTDWTDMKRLFGHKYVTEDQIQRYQVKRAWNDTLLILD
ncbi:MAG: Holliday junction resolvase RecU [Clostridia bacterium]|nr:Holliday junction resolvase RecU [Clostridia bacterium]